MSDMAVKSNIQKALIVSLKLLSRSETQHPGALNKRLVCHYDTKCDQHIVIN